LPAALLAAVIVAGCTRKTPNFCRVDKDCPSNVCDTTMNLCGPSDGGSDGSDGSDAKVDRTDGPTDVPSDVASDVAPPCTVASCGGGTPVCDSTSKVCRGCQSGSECAPRDAGAPVCAAEAGVCVECVASGDCKGATRPVCNPSTSACRGCATGTECAALGAALPACVTTGASTGACVECVTSGDCPTKAKPVCNTATNTCRGCATGTECAALNPALPACVTTGASTGACVECVTSADCTMAKTKPVCNTATNTCRACQADAECTAAPGVCMAHVDGHCATPTEVIYVQNTAGTCTDTPGANAGTAVQPLCSMVAVPSLVSSVTPIRNLVVVRGTVTAGTWVFSDQVAPSLSIVGQQSALLAATTSPAFAMQSGSVYMRGVKVSASAAIGITAKGGALALDGVTVDSCGSLAPPTMPNGGGILIDGAAFDIRNTTITNNFPSSDLSWGGMRVASLSATGSKNLHLVTIQNNKAPGLSCASGAAVQGDGVLASGNNTGDVTSTCVITPCTVASSTCGAP
jgi:hypothetical protein